METKLVEIPIKSVVIFLFFLSNLNLIFSSLDGRTVNLILSPLFSNTCLDVDIIKNKVVVNISNKSQNFSDTSDVINLINEWDMHDVFRKFMIKSLSNANKNNLYRYNSNVTWICPLNIYYVFDEEDSN